MANRGMRKKLWMLVSLAAVTGAVAALTFRLTPFSLDPRIAQVKSQTVSLLLAEQRLGEVGPELAARLTKPGIIESQQAAVIASYVKAQTPAYFRLNTHHRAATQLDLLKRGLRLWVGENPKWVVTNTTLQIQYWQTVQITSYGAWVKVRGQFHSNVSGMERAIPAATFCLRLVGDAKKGFRIANEKWIGFNPS